MKKHLLIALVGLLPAGYVKNALLRRLGWKIAKDAISNVRLVPGAHVPARSVVAMGSVVVPGLSEPDSLYAGSPAKAAKDIPPGRFITRQRGPVDLPLPYGQ